MTLKRKLLGAFAALAAIALLVSAVALYATLRWQATAAQIEVHYQRSLLLQRVRAGTFQALKEVDDALTGDHVDALTDFERALAPTQQDFNAWAALADTPNEQAEVTSVRTAHALLIANARRVFSLVGVDRPAAVRFADDEVDTNDYEQFRLLTEAGVQADQARRQSIEETIEQVRTTTFIMIGVCAVSVLSLIFLISAYLSQDVFRQLHDLARVVERWRRGETDARADGSRDDEIGTLARHLNALTETQMARTPSIAPPPPPEAFDSENIDPVALIHAALARFRHELLHRAVGLELSFETGDGTLRGDRRQLLSAMRIVLRAALDALPKRGGRLGVRTVTVSPEGLCVEIAENAEAPASRGGDALRQAEAIMTRHGGSLSIFDGPRGRVVRLALAPLQARSDIA